MTKAEYSRHVVNVSAFIAWFDNNHMQGGVKAEDAFTSFCALMQLDRTTLYSIARGEFDIERKKEQ